MERDHALVPLDLALEDVPLLPELDQRGGAANSADHYRAQVGMSPQLSPVTLGSYRRRASPEGGSLNRAASIPAASSLAAPGLGSRATPAGPGRGSR
jgi:hypothetical protein